MQLSRGVWEVTIVERSLDGRQFAKLLTDEPTDDLVDLDAVLIWNNLDDLFRTLSGRLTYRAGFAGVRGDPSLDEHVQPSLEAGKCHLGVQRGPCTDDHGIKIIALEQ